VQRRLNWISLIVFILLVSLTLVSCNQSQKKETPPTEQQQSAQSDKEKQPTPETAGGGSGQSSQPATLTKETETAETGEKSGNASGSGGGGAATASTDGIKNPDTLTIADPSDIDSLDPAYVYDTASGEILFHTYDNLLTYDGPYADKFKEMLATTLPSTENGLIQANSDGSVVISFPIRADVKFHDGATLTPEDVAYSFQRLLLFDRSGGPSWLLLSPLLNVNAIAELAKQIESKRTNKKIDSLKDTALKDLSDEALNETCERVQKAVKVNGDKVEFRLPAPFPPFFAVIAQSASWASILSKSWSTAQGAWDGQCSVQYSANSDVVAGDLDVGHNLKANLYQDNDKNGTVSPGDKRTKAIAVATWANSHDPEKVKDPLYDKINGTGPFKLETWDRTGKTITLVRNDQYWREPAKLQKIVIKYIEEASTRRLMLENGDADIAFIDRAYVDQVDGTKGVRLIRGQVQMAMSYVFMNQAIKAQGNTNIGSGQLDGNGIPSDFFKDVHIRKAFSYLFDWDTFIKDAWKGEARKANGPIPNGISFRNNEQQAYTFDLKQAEEHFKQAFNGKAWNKGFKFTAFYRTGSAPDQIALEILRRNLQQVNPKFVLEVVNVDWSTLLRQSVDGVMPLFPAGWLEDFHDAHNWVFPVMHSKGTYSEFLSMGTKYDADISAAVKTYDNAKRQEFYNKIQQGAYDDALVIFLVQQLGRHYQRRWVDGYYFNPIWPGRNFYVMSKKADAKPNLEYTGALQLEVQEW
jgi:peptide/nickel transport system substrate-binding protein